MLSKWGKRHSDSNSKLGVNTEPEKFENISDLTSSLQSINDLDIFTTYCSEHLSAKHRSYLFEQYTFEIYEAAFNLTVGSARSSLLPDTFTTFLDEFVANVPPREVYLVAIERLLSGADVSSLSFLLYTLQLSLNRLDSIDVYNAGLTTVLNRCVQICGNATSALEEEEGMPQDSDNEDNNKVIDNAPTATQIKISHVIDCVVKTMITFAAGCMRKESQWLLVPNETILDCSELNNEKRSLLIGFLLSVASQLVILVDTNDELRTAHTATITGFVLTLIDQPTVLLNHFSRERYRFYRVKRSTIVNQIVNDKVKPGGLVPSSSYEKQLSSFVLMQQGTESQGCDQVIPCEYVTDDYRLLHNTASGNEKFVPVNYYSDSSSGSVSPVVSVSLPWSITGIAMIVNCILTQHIMQVSGKPVNNIFPLVYSAQYVKQFVEGYRNILTRHSNLAVYEGLLYTKAIGMLIENTDVRPIQQFLLVDPDTTKGDHLLNRYIGHCYCITEAKLNDVGNEQCLAIQIAQSSDVLTVCNNIVIAIASCHDGQRCSEAFAGLRSILKQFDSKSLMCLLLRLIEQCPFVFISGLLIDLLKECVQAHSMNRDWGYNTIYPNNHVEATRPPHNILNKVFKGLEDLSENTAWEWFKDSNLLELPLRNYSLSVPANPNAEDGSGCGSPSINTELCGDIYSYDNKFPCWSPLISRSILPHLQHVLKWTTIEKVLENSDVIAAIVNLIQFIAMRMLSAFEESNSDNEAPRLLSDSTSLVQYFSDVINVQAKLISSIQDLIQLLKGMKLVQELICDNILVAYSEKVAKKQKHYNSGSVATDLVRVQLLGSNIRHCVTILHKMCLQVCWIVK